MKVLMKKFRRSNFSTRLIYLFVSLLFSGSYVYMFINLLKLSGIETTIRIILLAVIGLFLVLYLFFGLILLLSKHNKTLIFISFIVMVISCGCLLGSTTIDRTYTLLDNMQKDTILYTTNLITLKDKEFKNDPSFKVGMFSNETDTEGNVLAKELIKKEKLNVTVSEYDTYFEMLELLYNGKLDGVFITSNFGIVYSGYEAYKNIETDVKVQFEYSKEMDNQDFIESSGSVDKPFTLLIMGVDSTSDKLNANAGFNGDTLMLITFNPHTLNATVFSIPRDTYVPIACLKNQSSKINSSAAYGTNCVINTVQNLVDIKIDYYVKINFKGVVDLVNALGGVDITVPDGINFCEQNSKRSFRKRDLQCISSGFQHMDGEKALAFARHRKTLPAGDFQRVQHQQLVVEAIANSAKNVSSVNDFMHVLEAISDNINTNMQTKEMLNLYNVGKNVLINSSGSNIGINIQKTYLTGYDLIMYVQNIRHRVYTFQYYEQSLEEIKDALKINLELKSPTEIKTFDFSVNDIYKPAVIGKKYYQVQRNETIPEFTGKLKSYAEDWCRERNIEVNIRYITKGMTGYDSDLAEGYILSQSVNRGMLVKDVSSIMISVIKHDENSLSDEHLNNNTNTDHNNEENNDHEEEKPTTTVPITSNTVPVENTEPTTVTTVTVNTSEHTTTTTTVTTTTVPVSPETDENEE